MIAFLWFFQNTTDYGGHAEDNLLYLYVNCVFIITKTNIF